VAVTWRVVAMSWRVMACRGGVMGSQGVSWQCDALSRRVNVAVSWRAMHVVVCGGVSWRCHAMSWCVIVRIVACKCV
jgi:hypothetical protein